MSVERDNPLNQLFIVKEAEKPWVLMQKGLITYIVLVMKFMKFHSISWALQYRNPNLG